ILTALNAIFMYCWYHNSLSHILIAINRLFVIVFSSIRLFTRPVTIALCILQHALALSLAITSQFMLPCCDLTYTWVVFSYQYNTKEGIINYANEYIDLPLNSTSSIVSMICYTVIIARMHYARLQTRDMEQVDATLLHKEYRYAIQFATMAFV
ncbi:hypothetical protein PRIPAC_90733, partial [Pristionchus pacificus]